MYELKPSERDESLFFKMVNDDASKRHGAIGYLRADFGSNGEAFFNTWFDTQASLNTQDFKCEFEAVIDSLRNDGEKPPFASRKNLKAFMATAPGKTLEDRGEGYTIQTLNYSYFFRCFPRSGDYDIFCFAYDNGYLLPELER